MNERMRAHDWEQSPLGPVTQWPQSLKTTLRLMLGSKYPMFVWWGERLTNFYNDAYIPVLGQRHPDALGRPARDLWADIWDVIGPQVETVLREGRATWNEELLLIMHRNNFTEETYFTFSYSPVSDEQGKVCGVFCACTEETARVLSQRRLRTLRALAEQVIQTESAKEVCAISAATLSGNAEDLPFALIYLLEADNQRANLAGTTGLVAGTRASPAEIEIGPEKHGWPLAEVLESRSAIIVTDLESLFGALPGRAWPEPPQKAIVVPMKKPGHDSFSGFLIAGISPRLIFDADYRGFTELAAGHIGAAIGHARAYEEERARAEVLAELDRAKTAFFSNVSHEFRTPLTLMLGPVEEALADTRNPLPAEQRERLGVVQRNSLRLLKLVNTLLDFSRIEAGRAQASYDPIDLAAYTAELASVFRSAVGKAGLRLIVDCPPLSEKIYVDQEMWEKIVLNLLSNAFKFTFKGEIALTLEETSERVILRVRDTGTGIPEVELPHLFKRFHRVKNAEARTHEGTGIGLALVQELIKLHGGEITVESSLASGSIFTVSIPKGKDHLPPKQIASLRTQASKSLGARPFVEEALSWLPPETAVNQPVAVSLSAIAEPPQQDEQMRKRQVAGSRILLVDDNADMREYLGRLLSNHYEVQAVDDGQAALAAAYERVPDLVLTDVMMPRLDGFGLVRGLREDPRTSSVPVIMLSARAGEDALIEGLEAGADDYLIKPFSARELLAQVNSTLEIAHLRREAEKRFRNLADNAPVMIWLTERDGSCSYLSKSWYEFTGQSTVQRGDNWVNALHPDDQKHAQESFAAANARRETFQVEYRLRRHDGEYRWAVDMAQPRFGEEGEFLGYIGSVMDITERKQAESRLRESEAKFRILSETAPALIWFDDAEGNCQFVNQQYVDFSGKTLDQLKGQGWQLILHEEDSSAYLSDFAEATRAQRPFHHLVRARRFDGKWRWLESFSQPLFATDGSFLGHVGVSPDITERKEAEEDRERLLEREQGARHEAEIANRLKDEFLATLSHELRTPLNAIIGWTHLLRGGRLDDTAATKALEAIERSGHAQKQLIEDLLDVSRIISGTLRLEMETVDLSLVIKNALETVGPTMDAKGIELRAVLDPSVPSVRGDAGRLQQILLNLLSNAIKFTPGEGTVEVRLESTNSHAHLMVSDTGQGIDPDFLPHVFDRFRQSDMTTTRTHGGLGLGLAIVSHLVELHGGSVEASSEGLGRGAMFTLRLPLENSTVKLDFAEKSANKNPEQSELSLAGVKVLLVDDEHDTCELLGIILRGLGAKVTCAFSASEGLTILRRERPDVLISDIGMPNCDGNKFIKIVRALSAEEGGQIPAAALTAYAREEDTAKALRAGFQTHISKPVNPTELARTVAQLAKPLSNAPIPANKTL
jgi:PAS domain S-box-containing protein